MPAHSVATGSTASGRFPSLPGRRRVTRHRAPGPARGRGARLGLCGLLVLLPVGALAQTAEPIAPARTPPREAPLRATSPAVKAAADKIRRMRRPSVDVASSQVSLAHTLDRIRKSLHALLRAAARGEDEAEVADLRKRSGELVSVRSAWNQPDRGARAGLSPAMTDRFAQLLDRLDAVVEATDRRARIRGAVELLRDLEADMSPRQRSRGPAFDQKRVDTEHLRERIRTPTSPLHETGH